MIKFLDLHGQYLQIKPAIDQAIEAVIKESAFIGGAYPKHFEAQFAEYVGVEHCIGTGNGTDALEIAIEALKLPKHSEIVVPGNSFIASSEAVTRCGHKVVFADVDPTCYTINAAAIKAKLTERTSAVVAVHLYGHPCDMDEIRALTNLKNMKIIEDCAQAHGATYKGQKAGSLGDIAAFSFYPGKNLGAYGDAGAITTNSASLAILSRKIANHGRVAKYDHEFEGRSSRLDGLQAAILSAKLASLEGWTERRIAIAERYLGALQDIREVTLPLRKHWARQVYHLFVIRTDMRDELKSYLLANGVEAGIHYPIALPKLAAYEYLGQANEELFVNKSDSTLLSLPIGEHLSDADVDYVIRTIKSFFGA